MKTFTFSSQDLHSKTNTEIVNEIKPKEDKPTKENQIGLIASIPHSFGVWRLQGHFKLNGKIKVLKGFTNCGELHDAINSEDKAVEFNIDPQHIALEIIQERN